MESLPANLSINQVIQEIRVAQAKQAELDVQLGALMAKRKELEKKIDVAVFPTSDHALRQAGEHARQLALRVSKSSVSAVGLSRKVRELDTAQSRVRAALERVQSVLDNKSTIEVVESALERQDYQVAATQIHRVLHQQKPVQNDVSYQVLLGLENRVKAQVIAGLEHALQVVPVDLDSARQFSRLFPLVGLPFDGLITYCQLARQSLSQQLTRDGLTLASQPDGAVVQYEALVQKLIAVFHQAIRAHAKDIQTAFGRGTHLRFLQELQREYDLTVAPMLKHFMREKQTNQLRAKIPQYSDKLGPENEIAGLEMKEVDMLLTDMEKLSNLCEVFDLYIRNNATSAKKALEAISQSTAGGTASAQEAHSILNSMKADAMTADLLHVSKTNEALQELMGAYVALEEYYLVQNTRMAIRMNKHEGAKPLQQTVGAGEGGEGAGRAGGEGAAGGWGVGGVASTALKNLGSIGSSVADRMAGAGGGGGAGARVGAGAASFLDNAQSAERVEHGDGFFSKALGPWFFEETLTRTMVDDVFCILENSATRAISTYNLNSACAVLNHVLAVLRGDFKEALSKDLTSYAKTYRGAAQRAARGEGSSLTNSAASLQAAASSISSIFNTTAGAGESGLSEAQKKKLRDDAAMLAALNDVEYSMRFVGMLHQRLQEEGARVFAHHPAGPKELFQMALDELKEVSSVNYNNILHKGLGTVLKVVEQAIRPWVEAFEKENYELGQDEYSERELGHSFTQPLIQALAAELEPLQPCLSELNFDTLVQRLLKDLTLRLEKIVFKKRFSLYGGMQLDADVRKLSSYFSTLKQHGSVRDKVARLTQMAAILQLDTAEEVSDYWTSDGGSDSWRLYDNEVRKVLELRGFSQREILSLKLS